MIAFDEVDKKKREEAELKNESDNLIYSAEKLVNQDLKDKVTAEQKEKVNKSVQDLKDSISANNVDNIKAKITDLKNVLAEISTAAYQSVQQNTPSTGTGEPGPDTSSTQPPPYEDTQSQNTSGDNPETSTAGGSGAEPSSNK